MYDNSHREQPDIIKQAIDETIDWFAELNEDAQENFLRSIFKQKFQSKFVQSGAIGLISMDDGHSVIIKNLRRETMNHLRNLCNDKKLTFISNKDGEIVIDFATINRNLRTISITYWKSLIHNAR